MKEYNSLSLPKTKHSVAVGTYMSHNAKRYNLNPQEMYIVGLLHDIGYLYGREDHSKNGVALLSGLGFQNENVLNAIRYHDTRPNELSEEQRSNPILNLLWEADLSIDKDGHDVGFSGRLQDIASRYGYDSKEFITSRDIVAYLKDRYKSQEEKMPLRDDESR